MYKGKNVRVKKGQEVQVEDKSIPMDELPYYSKDLVVLGYPGRTFVVVIPQLSIEARFYEENAGFAVKVPSRRFFNRTVGLCGNCNGKKEDELKEEPVKEFVCSCLIEGDLEACKESFEDLPELVERVGICEKLKHPIFKACHPLIEPDVYIDACSFDAQHSEDHQGSLCKSAMEYGRQCCQAGIEINQWPEEFGCDIECPEGFKFDQCHNGCPQTCFGLKNSSDDVVCEQLKVDGCFCPEGKVIKDNECVETLFCNTCDEEGHVPGDYWNDGDCRKCLCKENLVTECTVELCPSKPICSQKEILVKLESEDSCCEKFSCAPVVEEDCPPLDVPDCLKGEVAKIQSSENLCPELKCECDPVLCPYITFPDDLEIGQIATVINETCCPKVKVICNQDLCPEKPECPQELQLTETEGECCNLYKCKPPKDVCFFKHTSTVVEGLEVFIDPDEIQTVSYKLGDTWQNGLCESCTCEEKYGMLVPSCTTEHCPSLETLPDNKDYVLHELNTPGSCCPIVFRIQCKDEYGNIYEPGEEWQDVDDPCVTYVCDHSYADVHITKRITNCTECPRTSEILPPSAKLGQCCGICRPSKCEDDDVLYSVGETWVPSDDSCTKAECLKEFGKIRAVYTRQPCPALPEDCPEEKIIKDEKGCCLICNMTSELSCSTAPIPEEDTVGFFTYRESRYGGVCVNLKPVPHVLQCKGACHSQSYYSLEDGDFKSMCMCCKVDVTVNRTVELRCPDGNDIVKQFLQPQSCQCSKCAPKTENKIPGKTDKQTWQPSSFGQEEEDVDIFEQKPEKFEPFGQEPLAENKWKDYEQNPVDFDSFGQEPLKEEQNWKNYEQNPVDFETFEQRPEKSPFEKNQFQQQEEDNGF